MGKKSSRYGFLHLLPALVGWIIFLSIDHQLIHSRIIKRIYGTATTISLLSYGVIIYYSLHSHTRWLRNQYSFTDMFLEAKWVIYIAAFLVLHTLLLSSAVSLLQWILPPPPPGEFHERNVLELVHALGTLVFLFIFSILARKQERHRLLQQTGKPAAKRKPESTVSNDTGFDELIRYMQKSKIYLENTLTLQKLAEETGIGRNTLSGLINNETGENFFHFVNGFRAREFREALENNSFPEYNLLGIAHECGFNSKTTFNVAVKKEFDKTPSQISREIRSTL